MTSLAEISNCLDAVASDLNGLRHALSNLYYRKIIRPLAVDGNVIDLCAVRIALRMDCDNA